MRVRLDEHFTAVLLEFPETGMGYQRVDVRFRNGRRLNNAIVFNSEEIELPTELASIEIVALEPHTDSGE